MSYQTEQEAIEAAMYLFEFIAFEGMDCNAEQDDVYANCLGWDGESRRCDCGNHTPHWEYIRNQDRTIEYAYATIF